MATFYVGGINDDASETGTGTFYPTTSYVYIISNVDPGSGSYFCGGFRFPNITIPKGSTINAASFWGLTYSAEYDDMNAEIYGNDVDNALDFNALPKIISQVSRPRTTASVPWVENAMGIGWQEKTGLENIIEEIVGRTGWSSDNAIVLLFILNTDQTKVTRFRSYDGDPSYAAYLVITWTPPPPANPLISKPLIDPIRVGKPNIR